MSQLPSRVRPLLITLAVVAALGAYGAAQAGTDTIVVARVGASEITARELESELAQLQPFQRARYGGDAKSIARGYLERVLVEQRLLSEYARTSGVMKKNPAIAQALARGRADATVRAIRAKHESEKISEADAKRYFEANKSRYETPKRIQIWRVLCRTREEAVAVLEAAKKDGTPVKFRDLARDHSVDEATKMRGGNLGFIAEDGRSNEAGLRVDPALFKAADAVEDGQFVDAPVPEGKHFAVVWRRGAIDPVTRTFETLVPEIREAIRKERADAAVKKLKAELRAKYLVAHEPNLLETIDITVDDADIVPRSRPGEVPPLEAKSGPSAK